MLDRSQWQTGAKFALETFGFSQPTSLSAFLSFLDGGQRKINQTYLQRYGVGSGIKEGSPKEQGAGVPPWPLSNGWH